mmetsp:Transcript_11645/g.22930  ORF Transcript_11645/g.22930 Transcript_11645/m.22930 type:complete len:513 (+) Transcript_11645:154-1692(+)
MGDQHKAGTTEQTPLRVLVCLYSEFEYNYDLLFDSPPKSPKGSPCLLQKYWVLSKRVLQSQGEDFDDTDFSMCVCALLDDSSTISSEKGIDALYVTSEIPSVFDVRDRGRKTLTTKELDSVEILIFMSVNEIPSSISQSLFSLLPKLRSLEHLFLQAEETYLLAEELMIAVAMEQKSRHLGGSGNSRKGERAPLNIFCWHTALYSIRRTIEYDFMAYYLEQLAIEKESSHCNAVANDSPLMESDIFAKAKAEFPDQIREFCSADQAGKFMRRLTFQKPSRGYGAHSSKQRSKNVEKSVIELGIPALLTRERNDLGLIQGIVSAKLSLHVELYRNGFFQAASDLYEHLDNFEAKFESAFNSGRAEILRIWSAYLIGQVLGWTYHAHFFLKRLLGIDRMHFFCTPLFRNKFLELLCVDDFGFIGAAMTDARELPPHVLTWMNFQDLVQRGNNNEKMNCQREREGSEDEAVNSDALVNALFALHDRMVEHETYEEIKELLFEHVVDRQHKLKYER